MSRIQPSAPSQYEFALVIRGLHKSFLAGVQGCQARVAVLTGIEMSVRAGEIVGLCGAVGSGKTTLLLCLAGLLRPDAGTISVCGSQTGRLASYIGPVSWSNSRLSPSQHLARALAAATPVLLLDSVLADLSSGARILLGELASRGMSIVLAEREADALAPLAGRIMTLREGTLRTSGPEPHRSTRSPARVAEPNAREGLL
ncbi:MAG TPA: ATP-binding cassette domain-containing protein [Gemmatimonadaceae bacterium]|nr:ATP-binding cassette domain-containing protein [Gemmatimonadaceae bacterium]